MNGNAKERSDVPVGGFLLFHFFLVSHDIPPRPPFLREPIELTQTPPLFCPSEMESTKSV